MKATASPRREHGELVFDVTLESEAGTLTFTANEAGDFIHTLPLFEPSGEAWARIAEATADSD
jgi:hypothetical protein